MGYPETRARKCVSKKERLKQIAENQKRICEPIISKLKEIYINKEALPSILLLGRQYDLNTIFLLILRTDQEILDQELNQIKTFSSDVMNILIQRLTLIDSSQKEQKTDDKKALTCSTLSQLRSLKEKNRSLNILNNPLGGLVCLLRTKLRLSSLIQKYDPIEMLFSKSCH